MKNKSNALTDEQSDLIADSVIVVLENRFKRLELDEAHVLANDVLSRVEEALQVNDLVAATRRYIGKRAKKAAFVKSKKSSKRR